MADPLSLLQKYHSENKINDVLESEGHIVFGDLAWPKDVRTNFRVCQSEFDGKWDYYTLECILYFLKNIKQKHSDYVKLARGKVPIVHRPDRRDLIGFLEGSIQKKDLHSIDQSAPLQMPTNYKRPAEEKKIPSESAAKKPRYDGNFRNDAVTEITKKRKIDETSHEGGKLPIKRANLKNLSEDLTTDKIAEIRAKLLSNRKSRINTEDTDEATTTTTGPTEGRERGKDPKEVYSREKVWRTRTTILQSSGKTFFKTVNSLLASVKAREEGKMGKPHHHHHTGMHPPQMNNPPRNPSMGMPTQRQSLPTYNRYDQEKFKDATDVFNIETTQTFSGMTLKSVTEGNHPNRKQMPKTPNRPMMPNNMNGGMKSIGSASPGGGGTPGKRASRTPIIIIPSAPKSLLGMQNAKEVLQDCRFISIAEKKAQGTKRENELLIQRRKDGGLTVPYRVIDNPAKLSMSDWDRVVAVFVMGQAWQFKGWPWDGNPTVIFSKIAAYHIKWDDSITEPNIGKWAVTILPLSRDKRHLDRAKLMKFWETLDRHMEKNKPHLRF